MHYEYMHNDQAVQCYKPSLKELNEQNRQFWLEQNRLRDERLLDEDIRSAAMNDLNSEQMRGVPVSRRKTLESALADAAEAAKVFQRSYAHEFARRGGKKPKTDSLQRIIIDIVRKKTKITRNELLHELVRIAKRGNSAIQTIDHQPGLTSTRNRLIHFIDDGEKAKSAPVSGLKDRLSRAKKRFAQTS